MDIPTFLLFCQAMAKAFSLLIQRLELAGLLIVGLICAIALLAVRYEQEKRR